MPDTKTTVRAAPWGVAARLVPPEEMRDRLVELRFDTGWRTSRSGVAFYFTAGEGPDVAQRLRRAADELDAIYSEVRPL